MDGGTQTLVRAMLFLLVLIAMMTWETIAPRRTPVRRTRWLHNLGLGMLDVVVLRAVPVVAPSLAATVAARDAIGLFYAVGWPPAVTLCLSVLLLDFALWLQHVVLHRVPVLWRLHRVHHADPAFDVTTGIRFHPLESLVSGAYKSAVVLMLGAPLVAVIVFEALLGASALFNHGNVRLPPTLDALLRRVLVTPDVHRVHHSVHPQETNSNFGFNLIWWDRLFGTYRSGPREGHTEMTIGIDRFRSDGEQHVMQLFVQPWCGPADDYPRAPMTRRAA